MKRIAKLVIFLLLGAIVSVSVAWGYAVRPVTYPPMPLSFREGPYDKYVRSSPAGYQTTMKYRWGELTVSQVRGFMSGSRMPLPERLGEAEYQAMVAGWSAFKNTEPVAAGGDLFVEAAFGWPFLCLRYTRSITFGDERDVVSRGLMQMPWRARSLRSNMPCSPIPTGFLINTLFYGVIVWLFWSAPFTTRRLIRKRRGRCVKCGYDLTGTEHDVCPECGDEYRGKPAKQT